MKMPVDVIAFLFKEGTSDFADDEKLRAGVRIQLLLYSFLHILIIGTCQSLVRR